MMRKRREVKKGDQENEQPEKKRNKEKKKSKKILDEVELQTNTFKFDNDNESQISNTEQDRNEMTSILTMKHRNTSKELSKQVDNIDPNNIVKEINNVKDRMKEKLKNIVKDDASEAETKLNLDKDNVGIFLMK
jgi:hypothetical protein